MNYGAFFKAELRTLWVFFAVFMVVGIVLDLLVYRVPVAWGSRLAVALLASVVYAAVNAWMKMRKAR
ncbi:MAG: hypothetical protein KDK01_10720 [Rhodobacteraceae bacterium]|nr:hypothetical protein [Paracoccaceae bacterium]MCB1406704.1 hypothetical protein [Paracoccaceae bacterium]MCB1408770.1 hypothetical protein [Paracoccaceae bacterium]MCC0080781.1 hypothetical protein [Rhodobacter sp.]